MSNNEIDIALGCADSNFTKESVTGILAAEVRRLREENERLKVLRPVIDAARGANAPSMPGDEKAFEELAYQILSLALNNGTREAFPGKLKKLLKEAAHAKQS